MSDQPKILTRREFNLAGFSAGLAVLAMPLTSWAQEQQNVAPQRPPATKGGRKMAARKNVPTPAHVNYSKLQLIATIKALDTHLDLELHLLNTSKDPLDVPHTMGGIPQVIPKGVLVLSQQKIALDFRLPPEVFQHVTRSASVDYLRVQPSGKGQIKTFFARYISPWPDAVLKNQKGYATQKAKIDLSLAFKQFGLVINPNKNLGLLSLTTGNFVLPKTFKIVE